MSLQRITFGVALMMVVVGFRPVAANEINLVSPPGLDNVDGNASGADTNDPLRAQRLHLASEFASLDRPHYITAIALRADKDQQTTVTGESSQFTMSLSTTSITDLSATFADNIGPDNTLVFDGPISLIYPATGPAGGPHPFGTAIVFDTPYLYDPSQGNLMVDTNTPVESTGSDGFLFDLEETPNFSLSGGDPNATSGGVSTLQLVTQFTLVPVPEPSSAILLTCGLLGFIGWTRGR